MSQPSGIHSPFGINDNNFNRRSHPSNLYPPLRRQSGDPNDNFLPQTTTQNRYADFQTTFNPATPLYEKLNFKNRNELLHNNINEDVMDEHIVEYRIMLDSVDRDIKVYPDPFSYTVKFNAAATGKINHETYHGAPHPHIGKQFINVKYIKLENVILPQHSKIKLEDKEFVFDTRKRLPAERFVSLVIKELNNERIFTTSQDVTRTDKNVPYTPQVPFALILPDKLMGINFYAGVPYYGSKIYKNSLLGNITQLTIQFADSKGIPLKFNNLFTYEELQQYEFDNGEPLSTSDIRHPLNEKLQTHISLIFGVIESQINTQTKFDS